MPGLIACNRRWDVGSDDLVFPEVLESFLRLAWLITIAVIFNEHQYSFDCDSGYLVKMFYIGSLVLLSLQLLICFAIIRISMKGAIMDVGARKHMPILLYIKLLIFLPEFIWIILGTYWAFADSKDCARVIIITVKAAVLAGWIMFFMVGIGLLIVFDPAGKRHTLPNSSEEHFMERNAASEKLWQTRCKVICCCAACDDRSTNAFEEIAKTLTGYFEGLDLVPTDVAAGLILLQDEQTTQPVRLRAEPLTTYDQPVSFHDQPTPSSTMTSLGSNDSTQVKQTAGSSSSSPTEVDHLNKPFPNPRSWMTINNAMHYMKYAMGSYGWPLFVYMNPLTGCCRLWGGCSCCTCVSSKEDHIIDDNCCHCHVAAIKRTTSVDPHDIIYASFYNRVYEIPFYVALDHRNKSIIVAVRGTLSLKDAVTDLTAETEDFFIPGVGVCHAHKGIYSAAKYIKHCLIEKSVLENAHQRTPEDYNLVITGHSLGAGAATMLSFLLQPNYPNLMCFAYSPPGGLLSVEASRYTEDFICSVVVGQDVIPRLGFVTMEDLKVKLLKVIRDSSTPKFKILAGGAWSAMCGCCNPEAEGESLRRHLLDTNSRTPYTVPVTTEQRGLALMQAIDDAIQSSGRSRMVYERLYPPGHILFIDEAKPAKGCLSSPEYNAAWARADVFDEILVNPRMVTDHLPNIVMKALVQLSDRNYIPSQHIRLIQPPQIL